MCPAGVNRRSDRGGAGLRAWVATSRAWFRKLVATLASACEHTFTKRNEEASWATQQTNRSPPTLIPGDGIGPEIVDADARRPRRARRAVRVGRARWPAWPASQQAATRCPQPTLDSIRRTQPRAEGAARRRRSAAATARSNVRLREEFQPLRQPAPGAHAGSGRPLRQHRPRRSCARTSRASTSAFEHYIPIGDDPHAVAMASGVNTRAGLPAHRSTSRSTTRSRHGRKKVTIVHKANI